MRRYLKTYKFNKGLEIMDMSKRDRLIYNLKDKFEVNTLNLKQYTGAYKIMIIALGTILYVEKILAAPSTGVPKLDQGGWRLVGIAQSVIFWAAMLYTFRSLLELAIKGEGSWKKVGSGFVICAADYLIPWGFELIRGIFL